jgi:hypothetical protein
MIIPVARPFIGNTELLILAVPVVLFLSLLIRPGLVRGKIVRTFEGRRCISKPIERGCSKGLY